MRHAAAAPAPHAPASAEGWVVAALRLVAYAVGAAAFAFPLAPPSTVLAATVGAGAGSLLGARLARTALRTPAFAALGALGLLVVHGVAGLLTGGLAVALGASPSAALAAGDALAFGGGALVGGTALRVITTRRPAFVALEVVVVGLSFAQLVVAHRNGAINRPFRIADPVLALGWDPTWVFLAVGAVGALIVGLVLVRERSAGRVLLHLAVLPLVLLLFFWGIGKLGIPAPPTPDDALHLRGGDGSDEGQGGQGGGGGHRGRQSEDLEFRDDNSASQQRTPVAVVLFHDDYDPPTGVYYFRQGAFSQFNGRRLVSAVGDRLDADLAPGFPARPTEVADPPPLNANRGSLETTVAMLADHTRPFGLEAPYRFAPAQNPNPSRFRHVYEVESAVMVSDPWALLGAQPGSPRWSPEVWSHYTAHPDDPRYLELAQRIVNEEIPADLRDDPVVRLFAVTDWLGREGTYSLRSRHAEAADPTADFLFGDRTGYCVHFAHAATYLMRALGLPARVATGYAIDEAARQGGSALLISGESSHAWPEVYLDGFGWVVADVQPRTVLDPPPAPPDADLQRLLGELARGQSPVPPDAAPALRRYWGALETLLAYVGYGALSLALALLLSLVLTKLWRRLAPRWASSEALPRVAYREALDRLSEVAIRRRRGETREAFARRLASELPSFARLTEVHVGAAYGSARARAEAGRLRADRATLRAELRAHVPVWRRVLGALDIFSWLFAR